MKKKAAAEVGFHSIDVTLEESATQAEILAEVAKLNADPLVHGILVQARATQRLLRLGIDWVAIPCGLCPEASSPKRGTVPTDISWSSALRLHLTSRGGARSIPHIPVVAALVVASDVVVAAAVVVALSLHIGCHSLVATSSHCQTTCMSRPC